LRAALIAAAWLWAAAIVWLSLTPSPPQVDVQFGDKIGHFAAYGVLMLGFALLYPARRLPLAIGCIALGVALELAQGATGYRTLDALDMLANGIGVLAGWAGARLVGRLLH